MRIGNRVFAPRLIPTIVTLLLLPVLLRLGFWQLDRAEQKQQLLNLYQQQQQAGPLDLRTLLQPKPEINYRQVDVVGSYIPEKQVYLDNQVHKKLPGFHALTPFRIKGSDYAVLVNRGWVPMQNSRDILPQLETSNAELRLTGRLKLVEEKPFMLGDVYQSNSGWPALIQWLNIEDISKKSGLNLQPVVILLDPADDSGYVRDWKPVVMQPEKNVSYAVQWFSLAFVLLIIFFVVNLRKTESE